ncbi:hypothetical protein BRD17_09460, partial [Halobacteriales archaeon SW_7_68_16]
MGEFRPRIIGVFEQGMDRLHADGCGVEVRLKIGRRRLDVDQWVVFRSGEGREGRPRGAVMEVVVERRPDVVVVGRDRVAEALDRRVEIGVPEFEESFQVGDLVLGPIEIVLGGGDGVPDGRPGGGQFVETLAGLAGRGQRLAGAIEVGGGEPAGVEDRQ